MTSAASSYNESATFIHIRYKDTAHVIFEQQQKIQQDEKRRQQQHSSPYTYTKPPSTQNINRADLTRFSNHGVVATETEVADNQDNLQSLPSKIQTSAKSSVCIIT